MFDAESALDGSAFGQAVTTGSQVPHRVACGNIVGQGILEHSLDAASHGADFAPVSSLSASSFT